MSSNMRPHTLSSCHRSVIDVDGKAPFPVKMHRSKPAVRDGRAMLAVPEALCKILYLREAVPGRRYGLGSSRLVTIKYLVMCSCVHDYAAPGTEIKKQSMASVSLSP